MSRVTSLRSPRRPRCSNPHPNPDADPDPNPHPNPNPNLNPYPHPNPNPHPNQEAALLAGKHCWVDGSLRDGAWYEHVLRTIKQRHPRYRVAILHVEAKQEVILERVRRRGTVTGREVPEHEVLDSIQRVPQAVNQLAPLADFLAVIDNSAAAPHLVKYCDADTCFLSKADRSSEP